MPLPNGEIGIISNPLKESPFIQHWEGEGINPPPPGVDVRVTNNGDTRITNNDEVRITNII